MLVVAAIMGDPGCTLSRSCKSCLGCTAVISSGVVLKDGALQGVDGSLGLDQ